MGDTTSTGPAPRPPGFAPSPRLSSACSGCGVTGDTHTAVADLEVAWLVPGPDGAPAAARFCRACQPPGPLSEVACAGCGDGPLLAGALAAAADLATTAAIDSWLTDTGWRPAGPWCPNCAAPRARLGARRAAR